MHRYIFLLMISMGLLWGCSKDTDHNFDQGTAGPNTENLLKQLPSGLKPDQKKSSHTDDD